MSPELQDNTWQEGEEEEGEEQEEGGGGGEEEEEEGGEEKKRGLHNGSWDTTVKIALSQR